MASNISLANKIRLMNVVRGILILALGVAGYWGVAQQQTFVQTLAPSTATAQSADGPAALSPSVQQRLEEANQAAKTVKILIIALLLICLVAVVAVSGRIVKMVGDPLLVAIKIAENVAEGDLTSKIPTGGYPEAAKLSRALDRMHRNLTEIVCEVRDASDAVASAARELATGHTNLSQRTEHQASTLQQTAASMEELAAAVSENAENAAQAQRLAQAAAELAMEGGNSVGTMVETMRGIDAGAKKIADIIGVIDGIAFQTNLLALNAAVEAARAQEHGRGFAVVAAEVRQLAQRSAQAAKEIRALIAQSLQQVETGNQLVETTGKKMHDTVVGIQRVASLMTDIAIASTEQRDGVNQVTQAASQLDDVAHQNASLVEQASAATESLAEQAYRLVEMVRKFKLDEQTRAVQPPLAGGARSLAREDAAERRPASPNRPESARPVRTTPNAADDADWREF